MAEALKYLYSPLFFEKITPVFSEVIPSFRENEFIFSVFDEEWPDLELKQRVRKIALGLHKFLPKSFPDSVPYLKKLAQTLLDRGIHVQGFELIFLPDYIGLFGLRHLKESLETIELVTQLVSAEFAIRNFLLEYPDQTLHQILQWSKHQNHSVRRLASEGCRPRLPWAMGVPWLKRHPERTLEILENLKEDPSEYVRRSVANNLNDIAKDHPALVLKVAKRWKGKSPLTDYILRHGCRTLLKKGDSKILRLHGLNPDSKAEILSLVLSHKKVRIGEVLSFSFKFRNLESRAVRFRLDYAIEYQTSSGKTSTKIFKIKEGIFHPEENVLIERKRSFKDLTTRRHYKGEHVIHIHVNGKREVSREFIVQ